MEEFAGAERVGGKTRGCILTIGNFDGIHLGHEALLREVLERGRSQGRSTAVYTFDRHPKRVLQPGIHLPRLMSREQLAWALSERGIDALVVEPFTAELASLSAEAFIRDVLVKSLAPAEVVVGRDFRFGRGRSGTDETLRRELPALGIQVDIIAQVLEGGVDVSSTRIRSLLQEGAVEEVHRCLGRPYSVWGAVMQGDRRGRELGFPTANLAPDNELLPARGVYATRVSFLEKGRPGATSYPAVTNIGTRPTFDTDQTLCETHLLDFDADIYDRRISVEFHTRLRAEKRFPGPDALRAQIARDVEAARAQL